MNQDHGSAIPRSAPFSCPQTGPFWGRATEAAALARWWQDNRLTYVVGEAGRGKTSLLNAGILPLLDTDKATVLPVGQALPWHGLPVRRAAAA